MKKLFFLAVFLLPAPCFAQAGDPPDTNFDVIAGYQPSTGKYGFQFWYSDDDPNAEGGPWIVYTTNVVMTIEGNDYYDTFSAQAAYGGIFLNGWAPVPDEIGYHNYRNSSFTAEFYYGPADMSWIHYYSHTWSNGTVRDLDF